MEKDGRRKFLGVCLAGAAVAAAAATVYPVYRYLAPGGGEEGAEKVVFPLAELPEGEAKFFQFAGTSAVLVRNKAGEWIALSAICTHLGCVVQWVKEKQEFLCPCHAGQFSADGTVLAGPPPKPLPTIPVAVADGNITVG